MHLESEVIYFVFNFSIQVYFILSLSLSLWFNIDFWVIMFLHPFVCVCICMYCRSHVRVISAHMLERSRALAAWRKLYTNECIAQAFNNTQTI